MEKEKEYTTFDKTEWSMGKKLRDFYPVIDNTIEEGFFYRADVMRYLIERVKLAENLNKLNC